MLYRASKCTSDWDETGIGWHFELLASNSVFRAYHQLHLIHMMVVHPLATSVRLNNAYVGPDTMSVMK